MLHLQTLKFNNLGRFTEEQIFDFYKHEDLLLIDGPSGAGKSSTFHALDYLLGINKIPATQLQCRQTKKPITVTGIFKHDTGIVEIERSKKTGLTVKLPDQVISGNVDLAEQELDKLIGIPRKLFKKMIHKPQRDFGFFLKMTAKETYGFLIEVLGLKPYQDKIDLISQEIKDKAMCCESLNVSVEGLERNLEEWVISRANEFEPVCTVVKEDLQKLIGNLAQSRDKLTQNESLKQQQLSEVIEPKKAEILPKPILETIESIQKQIGILTTNKNTLIQSTIELRKVASNKMQECKSNLNSIQFAKKEAAAIGTKIAELKKQKQQIVDGTCSTCKQTWVDEMAQQHVQQLDDQINQSIKEALRKKDWIDQESSVISTEESLKKELDLLQDADTSSIDIQITGLQEQLSQENNKLNNLRQEEDGRFLKEHNLYLQKKSEINAIYQTEIDSLNALISKYSQEIAVSQKELATYESSHSQYKKKIAELDGLIEKKKKEIEKQKSTVLQTSVEIDIATEARRLVKGYTLQVFQETLDTVGENATEILSSIHNMNNASIYFEGCKETKLGTIKDEVNAIVTKEGECDIPIKTLSGGERTVIDLAVDLAVIDVIESKVGKGANFFIIDEPFDGLDSEGKEQYLDILRNLNTNKQIILVDHSPELKEMISDVIKVYK